MKRLIKKMNRYGFSLAETLMAILILLLVSSVIAAGIPAATSAYLHAVDGANAQTILSTTINAMRSELSTALGKIIVDDSSYGRVVFYYSMKTNSWAAMYNDDSSGSNTIMIQDFLKGPALSAGAPTHELISASNRKMTKRGTSGSEKYYGISYTPPSGTGKVTISDVITFSDVMVDKDDNSIAFVDSFSVKLLDPSFEIPEI